MKYFFFISILFFSCNDKKIKSINNFEFTSCYSPEFGVAEGEEFFYNINFGELEIELDNPISATNLGYSIRSGSKTIFVYRHFLSNSFNTLNNEVEIRILFQIDSDLSTFNLNDSVDFQHSKLIYAECGIVIDKFSGHITGNKTSNESWVIDANLKVQRFNKSKEIFIKAKFET